MSAPGVSASLRVLDMHQKSRKQVSEAVMAAWLSAAELTAADKRGLRTIARVIDLQAPDRGISLVKSLQVATEFLHTEFTSIIADAKNLEAIRLTLKAHDSQKTSALLRKLNIEDPSAIEDATASIPISLVDVVERVRDGEFEISFPLTHLKPLQRLALGAGSSRAILVRLVIGDVSKPPEFCIHLYPEPNGSAPGRRAGRASNENTSSHTYWIVSPGSSAPDDHICHGRPNRVTYQLGRDLHRHLLSGYDSLAKVHAVIASKIESLAQGCMVCGSPITGARLWRSTCCQKTCSITLRRSHLEVRLTDVRYDTAVVDLLLSSVYAAAVAGRMELLSGCPITTGPNIIQALNNLPAISTFQNVSDLTASVISLGALTRSLLSWVCTSYRGFLASATGVLKIPSMPGAHQFVLASAFPEKERSFEAHGSSQRPRIVFHGTSLDRLYAILRQGLLVMRKGPLQAHGAAYGEGIYVADEPATSVGFMRRTAGGWHRSAFRDCSVLLGCELSSAHTEPPVSAGVYLVRDESMLCVRYVFLCPAGWRAPIRTHVEPALGIACASLRAGAV